MKRHFFWGCVGVVTLTYIGQWILPKTINAPPMFFRDNEEVIVAGNVCDISQKQIIINSIGILTETNQTSYFNHYQKDQFILSKKIPKKYKITCDINDLKGENYAFLPGNRVILEGKYQMLQEASNPGEFDEKQYYESIGVMGKIRNVRICSMETSWKPVRHTLFRVRSLYLKKIDRWFPVKEGSILKKMLLGDATGLDPEIKELYASTGIIHILSISGVHITLLGVGLYKLLRKTGVPVGSASILGGVSIILYGVMVGFSVSVLRAVGMYVLRMLAVWFGRTYDPLTALSAIAMALALCRPELLRNISFLYSFGSLIGILVIFPQMEKLESLWKDVVVTCETGDNALECYAESNIWCSVDGFWAKWKKSLLAGMSLSLMTMPIQLSFTYEVPIYAWILNLLVLPFVGVILTGGFLFLIFPGNHWMTVLPCALLSYYEGLCRMVKGLPVHTWNPGKPEAGEIVLYYFLLGTGMVVERKVLEYLLHKKRDNR